MNYEDFKISEQYPVLLGMMGSRITGIARGFKNQYEFELYLKRTQSTSTDGSNYIFYHQEPLVISFDNGKKVALTWINAARELLVQPINEGWLWGPFGLYSAPYFAECSSNLTQAHEKLATFIGKEISSIRLLVNPKENGKIRGLEMEFGQDSFITIGTKVPHPADYLSLLFSDEQYAGQSEIAHWEKVSLPDHPTIEPKTSPDP